MQPATQNISVHRGATFDARLTVSPELPVASAAWLFLDAAGTVVASHYSSPAVVVDPVANTVDLLLTGAQTEALHVAGAATYQLDVQSGGSEPRILRGKVVWVHGARPAWPS